eukprot:1108848-Rhodomonas_salina.3
MRTNGRIPSYPGCSRNDRYLTTVGIPTNPGTRAPVPGVHVLGLVPRVPGTGRNQLAPIQQQQQSRKISRLIPRCQDITVLAVGAETSENKF